MVIIMIMARSEYEYYNDEILSTTGDRATSSSLVDRLP